ARPRPVVPLPAVEAVVAAVLLAGELAGGVALVVPVAAVPAPVLGLAVLVMAAGLAAARLGRGRQGQGQGRHRRSRQEPSHESSLLPRQRKGFLGAFRSPPPSPSCCSRGAGCDRRAGFSSQAAALLTCRLALLRGSLWAPEPPARSGDTPCARPRRPDRPRTQRPYR